MNIKNKIVIVTGASQGIGKATAEILASKGAKVVLAARSKAALSKLEKELPNSLAVAADMTKNADVKKLVKKTLDKYGRVDILINNAGQGLYGPVEEIDIDDYKNIVDLNVYGPLRAMKEVIPQMKKQGGGMIINVSSRVSKNHFPMLAAYASTKYALNAISFTAREELSEHNIIVSTMHPKMTATNFGKNSKGGSASDFTRRPGAEVDTPEAVAEKILELIESEDAEAEM